MTTSAALIEHARADGVSLGLDTAGKLKVRGDREAVARWLPQVRDHKPELVELLSAHDVEPNHLVDAAPEPVAYRWHIRTHDGQMLDETHSPPASRAYVMSRHPEAISVESAPDHLEAAT
jgi:hypothetical protein